MSEADDTAAPQWPARKAACASVRSRGRGVRPVDSQTVHRGWAAQVNVRTEEGIAGTSRAAAKPAYELILTPMRADMKAAA